MLRLILITPRLHSSPVATLLIEDLLRTLSTSHTSPVGGDGHAAAHQYDPVPIDLLSDAAVQINSAAVLPLNNNNGNGDSDVVRMQHTFNPAQPAPAPGYTRAGAGVIDGGSSSAGDGANALQRVAGAATIGVGDADLLNLMERCVELKRPLTAAFAAERLRLQTSVLNKTEWQGIVVRLCFFLIASIFNFLNKKHR